MKKLIPVVIGMILMAACGGDTEKGMTRNQAQAKTDSLVGLRTGDLMTESMEDLDRRMAIEVKPKADSIFAAWQAGQATAPKQ